MPEFGRNLGVIRAAALRNMRAEIDAVADQITGLYPRSERDSWPQKEAAALAILAGGASANDTALIGAEAVQTGEVLAALAQRIVNNSTLFRQAVGTLSGIRRTTEAAITTAQTEAGVTAALDAMRSTIGQMQGQI